MTAIVLATLNAKWIHSSFGLRYLRANLGELREQSTIVEFTIKDRPLDIAERILVHGPRIVGLGVYIWNARESLAVVTTLKRIAPDIVIVLGGPEVSYETDAQEIAAHADYVIAGEADLAFAELCRQLLAGQPPGSRTIAAALPEAAAIALPYDEYLDEDVRHRIVYVEASRGCPFRCEFCLSSLDVPVRHFALDGLLASLQRLLDRGVRHFKFVDRTFNLKLDVARAILDFFVTRLVDGLFLHFEMIPDRLPMALRGSIASFPKGTLQFEVGVQTLDEQVAARISRRQDNALLAENLRWLVAETGVHVHADLIVGLPGEDLHGFARGFDRLEELGPHEIQVGILKRLRGTPIVRHDQEHGMLYDPNPPYEVLRTHALTFAELQRIRRFARYWDLCANSGSFTETLPLLWRQRSPFWSFLEFSDALFRKTQATHSIALHRLAELLFEHLLGIGCPRDDAGAAMFRDYQRTRPNDWPEFLREFATTRSTRRRQPGPAKSGQAKAGLRRQQRHMDAI